ncbi:ribosome silencing factor [Desulforegula conservatrix]|uniref:ribosome silencing factor n=1 Tax=Desulforegula conservatrix TaxID=153026 RepID=UPI0003FE6C60|nr:ribosome silencing factor [Desulforegula conservatrix]
MGVKTTKAKKSEPQPVDPDLDIYVGAALGRKAGRLKVLDLRGISPVADYYIICSAKSSRQTDAIADHIISELARNGIKTLSVEGKGDDSQWVLLDYGFIMIHVFYEPVRDFYDLEGLWLDAPRVETQTMTEAAAKSEESAVNFGGDEKDEW